MKKFFLLLAMVAISHSIVISQGCLPEGITFNTQEQIDNFQANYPGCTEIEGEVVVSGSDITNLFGLNMIASIGGDLDIVSNPNLVDFSGLNALEFIGGSLDIMGNDLLESFMGLDSLVSIGGSIRISDQNQLNDISALQGLSEIPGFLEINSVGLTSLDGLQNVSSIGEYLLLYECHFIEIFNGLQSLISIGGDFDIYSNYLAENFSGLENLQFIDGNLIIRYNKLQSFEGLEGLQSVNGYVYAGYNYNLINLNGLSNLTQVTGELIIAYNEILTNISGIQNILPESLTDLNISYNQMLSECDVWSICQYLGAPSGSIEIHNNAPGCNSQAEVEAACLTSVKENITNEEITIFPNPAATFITITALGDLPIEEAIIYNHLGQKALVAVPVNSTVDVSKLTPGIYILEVVTENRTFREILLVE